MTSRSKQLQKANSFPVGFRVLGEVFAAVFSNPTFVVVLFILMWVSGYLIPEEHQVDCVARNNATPVKTRPDRWIFLFIISCVLILTALPEFPGDYSLAR